MPLPDFAHGIQTSFLDTATRARMKGIGTTATAANGTPGTAGASPASGGADSTQTASASVPLSFDDIVDIVNPLQHLPIISTLYEHYANDPINTFPKIAGDTLYGGPLGLLASVADTVFEKATGKSFGDTVLSWVTGDKTPAVGTALASAAKTAPATTGPATAPGATIPALTHLASMRAPTSLAPTPMTHVMASQSAPTNRMAASRPAAALSPTKVAAAGAPRSLSATSASQLPNLDPASFNALSAFLHDKGIDGDTGQRTLDAYRRTMQLGTELPPSPQALH
jgi:hypothetical protein